MKHSPPLLASVLAGALLSLLPSCAPLARTVPFDENAFLPYRGAGSCTVTGVVYTVLKDKSERVATHNATVKIMPASAYTDEVAKVVFEGGKRLQPPDPRFLQYVHKVHPDDDGHFAFHNLPPGVYYVGSHLDWSTPYDTTDADGNFYTAYSDVDQWVYAKCVVKAGETVNIDSWNQGE